jgi:hypothetical protein
MLLRAERFPKQPIPYSCTPCQVANPSLLTWEMLFTGGVHGRTVDPALPRSRAPALLHAKT